ncbi:hypothetical protein E2N90_21975 [Pseudomonas syringae pv. tomato]|nr:hypothetical protein EIZ61_04585 [Pseudomonas syringae]TES57845.1 hypothetical protein E2N91_15330 [Pseudomonas syringae pv. tomato]TES64869.1 hypothetical protein E2N90_21975 [Pseudomonas syringae pv. tomato]TES73695.1 hypothetical protein E2N89_25980 [Pseudomonas syringae pv. tomato]
MFAMGCEAALKPVTLAVSGTPRRPSLLPVPGSSRTSPHTSEASPGSHTGLLTTLRPVNPLCTSFTDATQTAR